MLDSRNKFTSWHYLSWTFILIFSNNLKVAKCVLVPLHIIMFHSSSIEFWSTCPSHSPFSHVVLPSWRLSSHCRSRLWGWMSGSLLMTPVLYLMWSQPFSKLCYLKIPLLEEFLLYNNCNNTKGTCVLAGSLLNTPILFVNMNPSARLVR